MTKEKLAWLLSDKGIYLGSASAQSDCNEGIFDHTYPSKLVKAQPRKYIPAQLSDESINYNHLDSRFESLMKTARKGQYISSWFAGENESEEMWENYASDGVAIIATNILLSENTPQPIMMATTMELVEYGSEKKRTEIHNSLFVKDDIFAFEREFRILFDPRKFSFFTGYNHEEFGECGIGNQRSFESEKIKEAIDVAQIKDAKNFICKKDQGYLFLYPLEKIITEIRINPDCTAEQEKEIKYLISDSGLSIPVTKS
ncbi:hypothetical protein JYT78_00560 [bacterium AH-315-I20]|nr:hypothetical protein [bacterium AH-315-I20]